MQILHCGSCVARITLGAELNQVRWSRVELGRKMREVHEYERILGKYPELTGRGVRVAGAQRNQKAPLRALLFVPGSGERIPWPNPPGQANL
jgi:hypothetical protein